MTELSTYGLPTLNFPAYEFRIGEEGGLLKIFDLVRKKHVVLTPEEWVRQHLIHYLHKDKNYPLGLMMVEKEFKYNRLSKRADIVVCTRNGQPVLMAECKSAEVEITQNVLEQASRYNLTMDVDLMVLSNGLSHFCFRLDRINKKYIPLKEIPLWSGKE